MDLSLLPWILLLGQIISAAVFIVIIIKASTKDQEQEARISSIVTAQILELETKLSPLEKELQEAKNSYVIAQNKSEELSKITSGLKDNLAKKEQELKKALAQNLVRQEPPKGTEEKTQLLEKENKELSTQLRDLKAQALKTQETSGSTIVQIGLLKSENTELKNALASKEQELKKALSQNLARQEPPRETVEKAQLLEKENKELTAQLQNLKAGLERLRKEKEALAPKQEISTQGQLEETLKRQKKKKIGEILLEFDFISKETLNKALQFQERSGGSLTQYLLGYGYIDEARLAQCLCTQFSIPYLPLNSYRIAEDIIKLIPVDIAEKYMLLPVDKIGDFLTVVMADPSDQRAIEEIQSITGYTVRPFVSTLSEIMGALSTYYKVNIKGQKDKNVGSFFVDTDFYKGIDRRKWVRFNAEVVVYFPLGGQYKKCKTINVSRSGLLIESDTILPVGSIFPIQIDLPKDFSLLPFTAVVQVVRADPINDNKFGIGLKIMKISEQELNSIIEYASTHEKK